MLIHDAHLTVINIDTGEVIHDLTLDTTRDGRQKKTPPT